MSHGLYHVISRKNSGDIAFRDSLDRRAFPKYLAKYLKISEYRIHGYCQMDTHFHLLLRAAPMPGPVGTDALTSDRIHHALQPSPQPPWPPFSGTFQKPRRGQVRLFPDCVATHPPEPCPRRRPQSAAGQCKTQGKPCGERRLTLKVTFKG